MEVENVGTNAVDEANNVLAVLNAHPRDRNISFEPNKHKYFIAGADGTSSPSSDYLSVTTYNGQHFEHFDPDDAIKKMRNGKNWGPSHKYFGMTDDEIKKGWEDNGRLASGYGSDLHYMFECFMNNPAVAKSPSYTHASLMQDFVKQWQEGKIIINPSDPKDPNRFYNTVEWKYFMNYINDNPTMMPYRTEWRIYHEELKIAGSIDMMYKLGDGSLCIFDWKITKDMVVTPKYKKYASTPCIRHLYDTNYWHYVLQLNTYKMILESKYGVKVTQMVLVRIHSAATTNNYELYPLPDISKEVNELAALRMQQLNALKAGIPFQLPTTKKNREKEQIRQAQITGMPIVGGVAEAPKYVSNNDAMMALMMGAMKM